MFFPSEKKRLSGKNGGNFHGTEKGFSFLRLENPIGKSVHLIEENFKSQILELNKEETVYHLGKSSSLKLQSHLD